MARITAFMDPYADARGTGFHMIQSQVAIASGERWGRGLGNGLQKYGYLPEDTTDFIFAIICEELGLMGAIVVVVLFCTLVLSGLAIVIKQRTLQAKILALGITATVGIQAVINLFVVVGWGPTKGIALPLLSSGGTGWILTAGALGVLVALDRHASRHVAVDSPAGTAESSQPAATPVQPAPGEAIKVMVPTAAVVR
jgi:cell division protein FtsW